MVTRTALFGWILTTALLGPGSAGATFDAAADFSATVNPDVRWTYGWSEQLGSAFVVDALAGKTDGLDYWSGPVAEPSPPGDFPLVAHNGTGNVVIAAHTVRVEPGQLLLHPGPNGEYAVLRFTTDVAGAYSFAVGFLGLDFVGPTTTDVHVFVDGQSIFDGVVDRYGEGPTFHDVRMLPVGATIDIAVGFGGNGFFYDSTAVDARVTAVPEPAVLVLLPAGLLLLLSRQRLRRARQS
jgi:hypothetical protein